MLAPLAHPCTRCALPALQVAALAQELPGLVATGFMDFLEEGGSEAEPAGAGGSGAGADAGEGEGTSADAAMLDAGAAGPVAVEAEAAAAAAMAPVELPHVTFLYKLRPGVAPRSFGLNVARMAALPASVVQRAAVLSVGLEAADKRREAGHASGGSGAPQQQQQRGAEEGAAEAEQAAAEGEKLRSAAAGVLEEVRRLVEGGGGAAEALQRVQELSRAAALGA